MDARIVRLQASFDAIEDRLKVLEACVGGAGGAVGAGGATGLALAPPNSAGSPAGGVVRAGESATVDRLQAELHAKGVSATFIRAPKEYYDESLEFRQAVLGAPSIDCLCKSIIMENTRIDEASCRADPSLIKYWLVIVQYACPGAKKELLNKCVHGLQPSLSKKMVNMRVVAEDTSTELSGFGKNAVSPVGLRTKMPIIMAKAIADLEAGVFWLGGGEVCIDTRCLHVVVPRLRSRDLTRPPARSLARKVDLKLGVSVTDFIAAYEPIVAPLY